MLYTNKLLFGINPVAKNILDLNLTFTWLDLAFNEAIDECRDPSKRKGWFRGPSSYGGSDGTYLMKLKENLYKLETLTVEELILLASNGNKVFHVDAITEKKCLELIKKYINSKIELDFKEAFLECVSVYYLLLLDDDKENVRRLIEFIEHARNSLICSNWRKQNATEYALLLDLREVYLEMDKEI
jgi:hypothetical protein